MLVVQEAALVQNRVQVLHLLVEIVHLQLVLVLAFLGDLQHLIRLLQLALEKLDRVGVLLRHLDGRIDFRRVLNDVLVQLATFL